MKNIVWDIHSIQMLFVDTVKHTAYFHDRVQLPLHLPIKCGQLIEG